MDSKICYNLIDVFDEVITMDIETKKMYAETMMYGKEKLNYCLGGNWNEIFR